jgi:hypothetical protein
MIRRGFLGALAGLLVAPAVITRPGLLMPVRPFVLAPPPVMRVRLYNGAEVVREIDGASLRIMALLRSNLVYDRAEALVYEVDGFRAPNGEHLMTADLHGGHWRDGSPRSRFLQAGDTLCIDVHAPPIFGENT